MLDHQWLATSAFVAFSLHGFCAAAQNSHCAGTLGAVEIRGNLDITGRCRLTGADVTGNVSLYAGGSLVALDVSINGNLDARRADFVTIEESQIAGNVSLDELVGDNSSIESTEISGNVSLTDNRSALEILNNDISGNVRATGNSGSLSISGNSIDGHLECSGNTTAPVGLGNRVEKEPQGQCRSMRAPQSSPPPTPTPTQATPPATPFPTPPPQATPATPAPVSGASGPTGTTTPAPIAGGVVGIADTTPPTLTLRGAPNVTLTINSAFVDPGATAMDTTDGDLTSRIVIANPVNTALLGTFTITYSVSDLAGNAATPVTRTVTVAPLPAEGGGGGGAIGAEIVLALLLLAAWRGSAPAMSEGRKHQGCVGARSR
jgi:hypothetical protein